MPCQIGRLTLNKDFEYPAATLKKTFILYIIEGFSHTRQHMARHHKDLAVASK